MSDAGLLALQHQVLWAALALGLAFGAIAQRTNFCTMGAVADVFNIGDWQRARMWALAAGVAMIGFNAMVALGWVKAADSIYAAPTLLWLSQAVGGLMFGFGQTNSAAQSLHLAVDVGLGHLVKINQHQSGHTAARQCLDRP